MAKKEAQEPTEKQSTAVKRALAALERAGRLTPEDVVASARSKSSPLHQHFEWNDGKAAEAWRLQQARGLIRSVVVQFTTTDDRLIDTPVYVRDPAAREDEQGYATLAKIKDDPSAARAALYIELTRIEGLLTRAEGIAEACGLLDEVAGAGRRVKALRKRVAPQANA